MSASGSLSVDIFLLILGISLVINVVFLLGIVRTLRIRAVRILYALFTISVFFMVYLVFESLELLGFISVPGAYPGIILSFAILVVMYTMILKGMRS
jgi:hypothetical protein